MSAIGQLFVELGINTAAFVEGMDKATYKAKQSTKEIGESFRGLGKDIQGIFSMFGEMGNVVGEAVGGLGETMAKASQMMGSMSGAAGVAGMAFIGVGAAAIAAGAGLAEMAKKGAELVHALDMTSQKTGISIRDLQGLQAAGSTVGLSIEAMTMGFRRFDQAITGIGRGGGAAQVILRNLGVTAKDNTEALNQVADAFSKMEDGPRKAADAVALFGRAGLNLIPLLNKGRTGLQEFNQMVDEYGPKIGKDATKANEDFLVSQAKVSLAWDRMKVDAEGAFLPTISKITTAMANLTKSTSDYVASLGTISWTDIAKFWGGKVGIGNGRMSSANTEYMPTKEEQDKTANARSQQAGIDAAQKAYDLAKAGGEEENKLRILKEKIADLAQIGTAESLKQAAALEKQLPAAEKLASLEKQRTEYRAGKATMSGGKTNVIDDMVAKLRQQEAAELALASAITQTTGAQAMAVAEQAARTEIATKLMSLDDEESARRQALAKMQISPAEMASDPIILQLHKDRDQLQKEVPEIIRLKQLAATGGAIGAAVRSTSSSAETYKEQAEAMEDLAAAYQQGGVRIQDAQIEQKLLGEQKAMQKARNELEAYAAVNGSASKEYSILATRLEQTVTAYDDSVDALKRLEAAKLSAKIGEETQSLLAEAAAWQINTEALMGNEQAKIAAAGAAAGAKFKVNNPTASDEQVNQVSRNASAAAMQAYADQIAALASTNNLNKAYDDENTKLELAKRLLQEKGQSTLSVDAAILENQNRINKEYDDAAIKVGNFGQRAAAVLDELSQAGQNFWGGFVQAGMQGLDQLNSELSKFIVTGKKMNLRQIASGMGENIMGQGLKTAEGFGAKALSNVSGLGGLLPGGKKDGSSEASALWVRMSMLGMPKMPIGQASTAAPTPGGGGGLEAALSMIPGFGGMLAGGGDVTPGNAYIVGEKHPEFFVPDKPGSVVPKLTMGNGPTSNVTHVHFHGVTDPDAFKKSQSQVLTSLTNAVGRANSRR